MSVDRNTWHICTVISIIVITASSKDLVVENTVWNSCVSASSLFGIVLWHITCFDYSIYVVIMLSLLLADDLQVAPCKVC